MIDNEDRETELAMALAALVQQVDINEYRDKHGHGLRNNLAFMKAQELVDRYGFSHETICGALSRYGDDIAGAAKHLSAA